MSRPPSFLRRVLEVGLPPGPVRETLPGDLEEIRAERVERRGRLRADFWYAGQVVGAVIRYAPARLGLGDAPGDGGFTDALSQDLRYALRSLRKSPGFTLVAVITLALGIGANTAIFSVVHGVLLRSFPFEEPDRLVRVFTDYPEDDVRWTLSAPDFMSVHDLGEIYEDVVAYSAGEGTLTEPGGPARIRAAWVSHDFLPLMGVEPALGRGLTREEAEPGSTDVAILGHTFWQRWFAGDPGVVGRELVMNGVTRTVVGVLPPGFDFPGKTEIWVPLPRTEEFDATTATNRRSEWLTVVGRLAPAADVDAARRSAAALSERLRADFPETNSGVRLGVVPLRDELVGEVRTPLLVLLGAVGLVLLIACANVANLLLARASTRAGELSVRVALGAHRRRLLRQLLTESLLLAAIGGGLGLLLAWLGTSALVASGAAGIPRLEGVGMNPVVVAFTMGVSLATGLLFGVVPALQATRGNVTKALGEGGRGGSGGPHRLRSGLVVLETALAVTLLVGAGLLARSFQRLTSVDPGFSASRTLTFDVSLPSRSYPDDTDVRQFFQRFEEHLSSLPGAETAATTMLPLMGHGMVVTFDVEGWPPPVPGEVPDILVRGATPGYFRLMGIPLARGRLIEDRDASGAPRVVVINEEAARRYFPGEDPLGRTILLDWTAYGERQGGTVVGVVGNVRQVGMGEAPAPELYMPLQQRPFRSVTMLVRAPGDPERLVPAARRELHALDPLLPLEDVGTLEGLLRDSVAQPRLYATLLVLFAAVALTLAAIGIFGVMAYSVAQRTREIGIRLALGGGPRHVRGMVVRRALALAASGALLGFGASALLTRVLRGMLYEVGAGDLPTYAGVAVLLVLVAGVSAYLPARRATNVEPSLALREG